MPSDDRHAEGAYPARSLSEKLSELEAQFGRISEISLPRPGRRTCLPTFLGRPIGLTRPDGFPRIAELTAGPHARTLEDDIAPPRRSTLRRGAAIAGMVLLLLAATAVVPPLIWGHIDLPATTSQDIAPPPLRTEHFAHVARDLALAPPAAIVPMPAAAASPTTEPAAPTTTSDPPEPALAEPVPARATTTIEVPESELAGLILPKIVPGVGSATRGSAVVIDGLPAEARVSHGIRISRDSWAIGMRDVAGAVLTLPRDMPGRIDLVVRIVAADSHELAANTLRILVLRSSGPNPPIRTAAPPRAHFEPAAGVGVPALEAVVPLPAQKPAVALSPTAPKVQPPTTWPTATSAWTQTAPGARLPAVEQAPKWAPFGAGFAP